MSVFFASAESETRASAESGTDPEHSQCGNRNHRVSIGNVTTIYIFPGGAR